MQNNIVHKYMKLIPRSNKSARSYLNLDLKFHKHLICYDFFDESLCTC